METRKEPWGENTPWKNSVAFFTYLRGCLRKAWVRNPTKLNLLNKKRKKIPNPNPKGNKPEVWGFDCEVCGGTFIIAQGQVDHIEPAGSLQKTSDIQGFVERLLYVTEDDLRLVCKECNTTLAVAQKQGKTFEEAALERKVTAFKKLSTAAQKELLQQCGVSATILNNAKARADAYREHLKGERIGLESTSR